MQCTVVNWVEGLPQRAFRYRYAMGVGDDWAADVTPAVFSRILHAETPFG